MSSFPCVCWRCRICTRMYAYTPVPTCIHTPNDFALVPTEHTKWYTYIPICLLTYMHTLHCIHTHSDLAEALITRTHRRTNIRGKIWRESATHSSVFDTRVWGNSAERLLYLIADMATSDSQDMHVVVVWVIHCVWPFVCWVSIHACFNIHRCGLQWQRDCRMGIANVVMLGCILTMWM